MFLNERVWTSQRKVIPWLTFLPLLLNGTALVVAAAMDHKDNAPFLLLYKASKHTLQ